ncbi:MAG: serine protease Do [Kiritimatiellia bacterium]|jgi:serine protease Do
MKRAYVLLMALLLAPGARPLAAVEEPDLAPRYRLLGSAITSAIRTAIPDLPEHTVAFVHEDGTRLLGAVVSNDGYLVTKASALPESYQVKFSDGEMYEATVIGVDRYNDVAFLQVEGRTEFKPVAWGSSVGIAHGHWLACSVPDLDEFQVGVVSANRRVIEGLGGVLGVYLGDDGPEIGGVMVSKVVRNSGAMKAGLEPADIIVAIEGVSVVKKKDLQKVVSEHDAGEIIRLKIERGIEELTLKIKLGYRSHVFERGSRNQLMSGPTSKRRKGFEEIIQTDLPLDANYMGGPVFGLDGKALGINIARVNRAETFMLPAERVLESIERVLNGLLGIEPDAEEDEDEGSE